MVEFVDDTHALMTGILIGTLMKAGIPAFAAVDDQGNYIPRIRLRLDIGHARPVTVELDVRAVEPPE